MKYIAEQFCFPFENEFFVGDTVVVTPTNEDDFDKFIGKATKVITQDENGKDRAPLLVVDNVDIGDKNE
jgi:phosphohistidine swiveling domain-containing protein